MTQPAVLQSLTMHPEQGDPVYTTTVQRGMMSQETMATGDIRPAARAEVGVTIAGRSRAQRG